MAETLKAIDELEALVRRHCLRYGTFHLSSGGVGKYYYNGKRMTLRPSAASLIGEALVDVVLSSGAEAVGGPELGAVPIAMAVGLAANERGTDLPVFVVRKEAKTYGAGDLIVEPYADAEGSDTPLIGPGRPVAIVEDAITTGGSVQKAIDAVEAAEARVVIIGVLVERHEGGADALRARGYDVVAIFRTDEDGKLYVNQAYLERLKSASKA